MTLATIVLIGTLTGNGRFIQATIVIHVMLTTVIRVTSSDRLATAVMHELAATVIYVTNRVTY